MKRLVVLSSTLAVLVVAASAFVVARSVNAGGGGCHDPLTDGAGTSVTLKHNCFLPTVLRVEPGTTVEFKSLDQQLHTVTGTGSQTENGWGSFEELGIESVVTETFEEAGVFPYFCMLHPGMVGTIVVGDGVPTDRAVTSASLGSASGINGAPSLASTSAEGDAGDSRSIAMAASGAGVVALLAGFGAGALVWRWRSR